ncbi:MAG: VOC family protein [Parvularculaceae bacterium]
MTELSGVRPLVIIPTKNREVSKPFFQEVLGMRLLKDDDFAAVFAIPGGELRLSEVKDWEAHSHTIFGFGVDDVERVAAALRAKGVSFERFEWMTQSDDGIWTAPDKSARVAWFKDPDGNLLSLTQFA